MTPDGNWKYESHARIMRVRVPVRVAICSGRTISGKTYRRAVPLRLPDRGNSYHDKITLNIALPTTRRLSLDCEVFLSRYR